MSRLYSTHKLGELAGYFNPLDDITDPEEMQKQIVGELFEEKVERVSLVKKWLTANADMEYNVCAENRKYLRGDVSVTWQVLQKLGENTFDMFGVNIAETPTVGSLATRIWQGTLKGPIPKILSPVVYAAWKRANRGGFSGVLDHFEHDCTKAPATTISGMDVTSLYPSSTRSTSITKKWFNGFPMPKVTYEDKQWVVEAWKEINEPMIVTAAVRKELEQMHGVFEIEYDDRDLEFPIMQKNVKGPRGCQALTYIRSGKDWFATPTIKHAFDYGVKMTIVQGYYVTDKFNPFDDYMGIFEKMKNEADSQRAALKDAGMKDSAEYRACEYNRYFAKLMLNSLLGRLNMQAKRQQTVYTKSINDLMTILGDEMFYQDVSYTFTEETGVYTIKYTEYDHQAELIAFNVAPYLSGYMLAYAKIVMAEATQFLSKSSDCKMLYTDTDSIYFASTEETRKKFMGKFVAEKKTFGMFEDEGQSDYFCALGPKKYMKQRGSVITYRANGISAKANVGIDVKETFQRILHNHEEVKLKDFKFIKERDGKFEIKHTDEHAEKVMRLICNKGFFDETQRRIKWYHTEKDWAANAGKILRAQYDERSIYG